MLMRFFLSFSFTLSLSPLPFLCYYLLFVDMPSACKGQTQMVFFYWRAVGLGFTLQFTPNTHISVLKHTPHCVNGRSGSMMLYLRLLGGSGVGHRLGTYTLPHNLSPSHFPVSPISLFFCIVTFCILDNQAYLIPFLQTSATYCNVKQILHYS